MDNINEFDIRLEKEFYYAGETIRGHVILHTTENFKLRCKYNNFYSKIIFQKFFFYYKIQKHFLAVRISLRGQAHAEWKIMVSGDRRNVKNDQYFVDERIIVWGHGKYIKLN